MYYPPSKSRFHSFYITGVTEGVGNSLPLIVVEYQKKPSLFFFFFQHEVTRSIITPSGWDVSPSQGTQQEAITSSPLEKTLVHRSVTSIIFVSLTVACTLAGKRPCRVSSRIKQHGGITGSNQLQHVNPTTTSHNLPSLKFKPFCQHFILHHNCSSKVFSKFISCSENLCLVHSRESRCHICASNRASTSIELLFSRDRILHKGLNSREDVSCLINLSY